MLHFLVGQIANGVYLWKNTHLTPILLTNSDFVGGVVHWKGPSLTNSHVSEAGNLSSLTLNFPNVIIMYVMEIS